MIRVQQKLVDIASPKVMGILNVTPDSFYDGGLYNGIEESVRQCEKMLLAGADFIDVGGQSTKPGSLEVATDLEIQRVVPVIEALHRNFPEAIISVDTNKSKVALLAVEAGAAMINDISAGDDDKEMLQTVASLQVPFVFMHKKGTPETMQLNPVYQNVVSEVFEYLNTKKNQLYTLGISDILADVGFGFGKTMAHNYELAANMKTFEMLQCPILVGISRKGMIYKKLATTPDDALNGTSVLHALILSQIPAILRVHDVKEAVETISLVKYWLEFRK